MQVCPPIKLFTTSAVYFALAWTVPTGASGQDYLVFQIKGGPTADGKLLEVGTLVHEMARLSVPISSAVTLFGDIGKIVVLGRYDGPINAAATSRPTQMPNVSQSIWMKLLSVAMLGSSSRGSQSDGNRSGWAIRIDTQGAKCIRSGTSVDIDVDSSLDGHRATIIQVSGNKSATLTLAAPTVKWPTNLPILVGSYYQSIISRTGKLVPFTFTMVDGGDDPDERTIALIAQSACNDQLISFAGSLQPNVILSDQ